jgi:hypothetical protein
MGLSKLLYVGFLMSSLGYSSPSNSIVNSNCDNFILSTNTSLNVKGTTIKVTAEGGITPYKYIFYKESGHLVSENFDNNSVQGLEKGKYFCTVIDKKNCKKTIELEIK